jgi:hypothetical protein
MLNNQDIAANQVINYAPSAPDMAFSHAGYERR